MPGIEPTERRVTIVKSVESEVAVRVYASSDEEAKRLAFELCPDDDSRCWTVVNCEVSASVEETCPR